MASHESSSVNARGSNGKTMTSTHDSQSNGKDYNSRKRPASMLTGGSKVSSRPPLSSPQLSQSSKHYQNHSSNSTGDRHHPSPPDSFQIKKEGSASATSSKSFKSVNSKPETFSNLLENSGSNPTSAQMGQSHHPRKKTSGSQKRSSSSSISAELNTAQLRNALSNEQQALYAAISSAKASLSSNSPSLNGSNSESSSIYRARPVRSCTHCRQQKIRCNALETFPAPCTRCAKMDRKCVVDPFFKPQKGGQVQSLRDDISSLKQQLAMLQRKSSIHGSPDSQLDVSLSPTLSIHESPSPSLSMNYSQSPSEPKRPHSTSLHQSRHISQSSLGSFDADLQTIRSSDQGSSTSASPNSTTGPTHHSNLDTLMHNYPATIDSNSRVLSGDSLPNKHHNSQQSLLKLSSGSHKLPSILSSTKNHFLLSDSSSPASPLSNIHQAGSLHMSTIASEVSVDHSEHSPLSIDTNRPGDKVPDDHIQSSRHASSPASSASHSDYIMGDVRLPYDQAEELHSRFMTHYLPFLPIIQSNSAAELYRQSQLLFWTVCLTASLSEPVPTLYNSLCSLIKQLAIETCWIQTPRSTHIVQALLILGNWPLPNEKVLDDCSYRFITLAKSLAMQLGLHRGKFIYEFSRTQVSLPDAEKWRTRTWISIFIAEQVWCANLGLPPNMPMDYLLEESRTDSSLPKPFRALACLAIFCSKLVNLLGSSVTSPDGTLEPKNRFSTLGILEQELDRLIAEIGTDDVSVEIYSLYLKMMICVFSFLPETPIQDQTIYIIKAYHAATRVVTLFSNLAEQRRIIEYPIYIRQPVSLAAFILFRLHLSPLLLPQYVESSRQSVVTVHRLFRNMLTAWKDVENDISRTAKVLEKLNFVIITHPELFTKAPGIITRMRSHLTASLFYELIWAIHEARRRGGFGSSSTHAAAVVAAFAAAAAANANNNNANGKGGSTPGAAANMASHLQSNSINSIPGSHVDSVLPLPFYNQITKDDFTATTSTTPNGTTITTLVPTHAHNTPASNNQTIPLVSQIDGASVNTTPLAGIGHPSTMLAAGADVAGSVQPASIILPPPRVPSTLAMNALKGTTSLEEHRNTSDTDLSNLLKNANKDVSSGVTTPLSSAVTTGVTSLTNGASLTPRVAQTPIPAFYDTTGSSTDPLHLDTLMQGMDWMNAKGDDLLGWMDNLDFNV